MAGRRLWGCGEDMRWDRRYPKRSLLAGARRPIMMGDCWRAEIVARAGRSQNYTYFARTVDCATCSIIGRFRRRHGRTHGDFYLGNKPHGEAVTNGASDKPRAARSSSASFAHQVEEHRRSSSCRCWDSARLRPDTKRSFVYCFCRCASRRSGLTRWGLLGGNRWAALAATARRTRWKESAAKIRRASAAHLAPGVMLLGR